METGASVSPLAYFLVYLVVVSVESFEKAAPITTCTYLYPKHGGALPQQTPSPYRITTNATSYSPNDVIRVRFHSPSGKSFRGLQASVRRVEGDTEELLGAFLLIPEGMMGKSWYPQQEGDLNCLSHAGNAERTEVEVLWKAPRQSAGDLILHASFLHTFDEFWVMKNALTLRARTPSKEPPFESEIIHKFGDVETEKCGVKRGCLFYPRGCSGWNCRFVISYGTCLHSMATTFRIIGESPAYISIAFSRDKYMGFDEVYTCIQKGRHSSIQHAHNPSHHTHRDRISNLTRLEVGRDGERLYCKFRRPVHQSVYMTDHDTHQKDLYHFDLQHDQWYLQVAWGDIEYQSEGFPSKHAELPIVSDNKVNILHKVITYGRTLSSARATHASIGVVSRMCLAGIAIIIARHFRLPMRGRACDTALWLRLHIGLNVTSMGLSLFGICVIFIALQTWTQHASLHAVLGLVTTLLMVALVVNGLVRPKQDSAYRKYFNWFHRIAGILTFFTSVACTILGFNASVIEVNLRRNATILHIAWLVLHVLVDLLFELNSCYKQIKVRRMGEKVESKSGTHQLVVEGYNQKEERRMFYREFTLLAVYIVLNLLFTVAVVFLIAKT